MRGMPHALVGAGVGLALVHLDPEARRLLLPVVAISAVAALLPDLDSHASLASRLLRPLSWLVCRLVPHRGPLHSLLAAVFLALLVAMWTGPTLALAVGLGYASHLATDSLTVSGVPWLWPASNRMLHLLPRGLRTHSGSWLEWPTSLALLWLGWQF